MEGVAVAEAKRGLGRGLGALIPTGPTAAEAGESTSARSAASKKSAAGSKKSTAGSGAKSAAKNPAASPPRAGRSADLEPVVGAVYVEVAPADVVPNPRQPRQVFDTDALAELAYSIKEIGLLQQIVVRRREVSDG